jgi:hypothetical protein
MVFYEKFTLNFMRILRKSLTAASLPPNFPLVTINNSLRIYVIMKKLFSKGFVQTLALTVSVVALSSSLASAVNTVSATSKVKANILDIVALTAVQDVDLGSVTKPISGIATYTINPNGSRTNSTNGSFVTPSTVGKFNIKGPNVGTVTYGKTISACSKTGVVLTNIDTSSAPATLNGSSTGQVFPVGATITVTSAAAAGAVTCNFTVSASY